MKFSNYVKLCVSGSGFSCALSLTLFALPQCVLRAAVDLSGMDCSIAAAFVDTLSAQLSFSSGELGLNIPLIKIAFMVLVLKLYWSIKRSCYLI